MIKFLIIIIKKINNLKLKSWTVFNLYLTSTTVRLLSLSLDNRIKNNIKKKSLIYRIRSQEKLLILIFMKDLEYKHPYQDALKFRTCKSIINNCLKFLIFWNFNLFNLFSF